MVEFSSDPENNLPLEKLLLNKSKKSENEITALKSLNNNLEQSLQNINTEMMGLKNEILAKSMLVEKMERDISNLGVNTAQKGDQNSLQTLIETPTESKDSVGIIPILKSQRDRYKKRFEEVEQVFPTFKKDCKESIQELDCC
jgi:hypothetical protein